MKKVGEGVEGDEEEDDFVVFPSQGHPIQFDDPNYDPYNDTNPFNTSPQRSPVPEYTRTAPEVIVSADVTELDDGYANQKDPVFYQIIEVSRIHFCIYG